MSLECTNCEVRQRQFYCKNCLKTHLRNFHTQHTHLTSDLKAVVSTAYSSLQSVVGPARDARARVAKIQRRLEELHDILNGKDGRDGVRGECERKRDRIRKLREDLATRRRTLGAARMLARSSPTGSPSVPSPSTGPITSPGTPHSGPSTIETVGGGPAIGQGQNSGPTGLLATLTSPILAYAAGALAAPPSPLYGAASPGALYGYGSPIIPPLAAFSPSGISGDSPYSIASPTSPGGTFHSTLTTTPIPPSLPYASLLSTLSRARVGLIQELVEVFNIVEVGGRPTIGLGGRIKGTRGEWTIGGLVLPVPGDIRRYPPDHINAVLTLTLHFLNLLSFYLGVKLPFEVTWSGGKVGLGQPWIGAIKGVPTTGPGSMGNGGSGGGEGSWARWYTKHPLHLSNSPTSQPPSSTQPIDVPQGTISASPNSESGSSTSSSPLPSDLRVTTSSTAPITASPRPPSGGTSPSSTPSPNSTPKRPSLFGLAKGVVGLAAGAAGRVRTFSGASSSGGGSPLGSSPATSSPLSGSPLRATLDAQPGRPVDINTRRATDGGAWGGQHDVDEELQRQEAEELRRQEAELEASMMAASPLPRRRSSTSARHSGARSGTVASGSGKIRGTNRNGGARKEEKEEHAPSFTIALAMLIYNVCYLGHTQGVDIPLNQSGEILSNLWRVCCSPEVGRFGHETGGYLSSLLEGYNVPGAGDTTPTQSHFQATPAHAIGRLLSPTPPSFTMEFGQVLQVISTAHRERIQTKGRVVSLRKGTSVSGGVGRIDEEDEFDMVERNVASQYFLAGRGDQGRSHDHQPGEDTKERDPRSGEEWDFVEGDTDF